MNKVVAGAGIPHFASIYLQISLQQTTLICIFFHWTLLLL
jgi:hypothetical protein